MEKLYFPSSVVSTVACEEDFSMVKYMLRRYVLRKEVLLF